MRKKLACCLATLMVGGALLSVGCSGPQKGNEKKEDLTKTQLFVGDYGGGMGGTWLNNLISEFETKYADYEFEPGKKGIQVWPDTDKTKYIGSQLTTTISMTKDVVFAQFMNLHSFVDETSSTMLDITDIVTEDLTALGDTGTIEDKIPTEYKDYFNVGGKYYALPFFNGYTGIVYDVDLFDSEELYFKNDGTIGASLSSTNKGTGPDGQPNTYDDGLPQTYEQFFALCKHMSDNGITPFIWTGQYSAYPSYLYDALFYDYEGKDRGTLQYNAGEIEGKNTAEIITAIDGDNVTKSNITIDKTNYKELAKQSGRYYALKFWETLLKNQYYSSLSFDDSESHLMAQADFLESTMGRQSIAMIIEGSWWQNEAASVFDDMSEINSKYSKENRRFGFMPMPKQNASLLGKATLADKVSSMVFIKGNIEESKIKAAKMFVQYACTANTLNTIVKTTGMTTALNSSLTPDDMNELSYYTKQLFEMEKSSDVVYTRFYSRSAQLFVGMNNYNDMIERYSKVGVYEETNFANAIVYRNVTAAQYFEGMYSRLK